MGGGVVEASHCGREELEQLCDAFPEAGGAYGFHEALREAGISHLFGGDFRECRREGNNGDTREGRYFA